MSESKMTEFNGYKLEMKKMRLKSANMLFPYVASSMVKMSIGNYNFFNDLRPTDIEIFQEALCSNCYKIIDKKDDNGNIITVKKNLELSDIDECLEDFLPLLSLFLEFNFCFFSKARKMIEPILTKASESSEK